MSDDCKGDGKVTTEFTVWCAGCAEWCQEPSLGSKAATSAAFIRQGWVRIRGRWYCKHCKHLR